MSRPPRVLMVTGAYHPEITGGARQCQTLIEALRHRVSFSVWSVSNAETLPSKQVIDDVPISRVRVDPARWTQRTAAALRLGWMLLWHRRQIDLVHLHGFTQKAIVLIGLAKLLRTPLVLKLGGIGQDDPGSVRKRGWLFWRSYRLVDRFIATSPAIERTLLAAHLPPSSVRRIPNGVDLCRFRPASDGERCELRRHFELPRDATVVLFVGMIAEVKRPDLLFDAWVRTRSDPQESMLLFCTTQSAFGEIDPAIAERITRQASALGLGRQVRFVEPTFEIERFYRCADIFVLPSASEGLPNALLEAMASGLACIASRLPGITDTIIDSRANGVLVESGDVQALACALTRLLQNPEEGRALGARARATIERSYGIGDTAARHFDLYMDLLRRRSGLSSLAC